MSIEVIEWVMDYTAARGATWRVAVVLANYARKDGTEARPSHSTLARKAKVARGRVAEHLAALVALGEIERVGVHDSRTVVYRFPMRKTCPATGLPRHGVTPPRDQPRHGAEGTPPRGSDYPATGHDPSLTVLDPSIERQLFDFWRDKTGRNGRTQFTPKRHSKLKARLKDSTPDEIRTAITFVAGSEWHRKGGHTDLELICRSRDQIEGYLARADAPKQGHLSANRDQWTEKFGRKGKP